MANSILFSRKRDLYIGPASACRVGYEVHSTHTGVLHHIGYVFQRGAKQTGKWAAQKVACHPQHGFATRADAALWLAHSVGEPV